MKRFLLVPMVGIIAALGLASAAALTITPSPNIAAGTAAVAACGTVSGITYDTDFTTEYVVTKVNLTFTGTCVNAGVTVQAPLQTSGPLPIVANATSWTLGTPIPVSTFTTIDILAN